MRESWIDFKILSTIFHSPISSGKSETNDDIVSFYLSIIFNFSSRGFAPP